MTSMMTPAVTVTVHDHAPTAEGEQQYEAVPIPGAYAGQAVKSPPPLQTTFNLPGPSSSGRYA